MHFQLASSARFIFVPGAFIILRIPSCIRTIHDYLHQGTPDPSGLFVLAVLQAVGDPGQGFVNGVFFCFGKGDIRQDYWKLVKRYICCRAAPSMEDEVSQLMHSEIDESDFYYQDER